MEASKLGSRVNVFLVNVMVQLKTNRPVIVH